MLGFNKGAATGQRGGSPLEQKLQVVRNKLGEMAGNKGSEGLNGNGMDRMVAPDKVQTIADDGDVTAAKQQQIAADEALVRPVLALFGVNYDDLIQLNTPGATSPYQRAVDANPAVLQQVLQSERPVLAALQVAAGFKPYAEFIEKYGEEPQSIREAMREELKQEMAATGKDEEQPAKQPLASPFSRSTRQMAQKTPKQGMVPLKDIFKR